MLANVQLPPRPVIELPPWLPLSVFAWAVQQLVFHVVGLAFEWCDRTGALRRMKVNDTDHKTYRDLLPLVLFNQCFVLLPSMIATEATGLCFSGRPLSPAGFLFSLPAMAVGHDVVQYLAHRYLLHQPNIPLMRALRHSVHHATGATKGISACYMSVPDFFLEIVLPYLLPLALIGGGGNDAVFHLLIAGLGAVGGVYEHSGYDFSVGLREAQVKGLRYGKDLMNLLAGVLDNRAHSEHHKRANVSFSDGFGSPGLCDTLLGTRWDLHPSKYREAQVEWQAQRAGLSSM